MSTLLKCLATRPMASVRLILAPSAGAGASIYNQFAKSLPASIEPYALQLPGRENRLDEPVINDWDELTALGVSAIAHLPSSPIALFGHSFGAVVALELARAWEHKSDGAHLLVHLGCAARAWPGAEKPLPWPSEMTDDELAALLEKHFGAAPPSFQNRDIRASVITGLRGDLALLAKHRWRAAAPLNCPLTIYAGDADPSTNIKELALWRRETTSAFEIASLAAGHYFLDSHRKQIIGDLSSNIIPQGRP